MGVVTADRYFREVEGCFDGGFCPVGMVGADSEDQWRSALKEASQILTYSSKKTRISQRSVKQAKESDSLLRFEAIVTTTFRDRDGDILETKGCTPDESMPLLWQHISMSPIGALEKITRRTDDEMRARFVVADTALGRDAAKLIRLKALRISHGFDPEEYKLLEDEMGFHFLKWTMFEASVVSIPSNIQAVITSVSKSKWASSLVKGWAERANPPASASVPASISAKGAPKTCSCQKNGDETPRQHDLITTKEFDVERQHVEAAKLEYDWISRFCSCEVKQLVNLGTHASRIRMGSFLTGLRHALNDSVQVDARRLTRNGMESPLEYETIQLNSTKSDNFLVDGISFRKLGDGTCFAVKYQRTWNGEHVEVFSSQKDQEKVSSILGDAWTWANENNFLKGEAFSLSGEFLPKTDERWGDLFLDESNEKAVKRCVDLLNAKGKACPNRGIVMMGPPGTGKTLSGRLIRNHAEASFVWVGGRDAYYYGGVGAVTTAFDLAKELAPAVIFMEDIDAALDSRYATDVLKTEMDGIGRSSGVTTILTTNHPSAFPEALLDRPGRFHDVLKFDLPSDAVRKAMLGKWLPEMSKKACLHAVEETKGYSGAHVYELCEYTKSLQELEEIEVDDAVSKALAKIADQRELINEELMGGRRSASRRRQFSPEPSDHTKQITRKSVGEEPRGATQHRTLADIELEYLAELAKADTDVLRKAHRRLSLILTSAEEQEEAREWDSLMSVL